MQTVRDTLRPEFYNRIDEFVVFDALNKQRRQNIELIKANVCACGSTLSRLNVLIQIRAFKAECLLGLYIHI